MSGLSLSQWVELEEMFEWKDIKKLKNMISDEQQEKAEIDEKEYIKEEDYLVATKIVKEHKVKNPLELFLYCSALNLLNAYEKQEKTHNYWFKNAVEKAILDMIFLFEGREDMSFYMEKKYGDKPRNRDRLFPNVTYINIAGIQFSFHQAGFSTETSRLIEEESQLAENGETSLYKEQEWEKLRLQNVASTLFKFAVKLQGIENEAEHIKLYGSNNNDGPEM